MATKTKRPTKTSKPAGPKPQVVTADEEKPICTLCSTFVDGAFVGHVGGVAHPHCFDRAYPPRVARTIYQMVRGIADPVLAAEIIWQMVPADLADKIVDEFNRQLMLGWLRRCSP